MKMPELMRFYIDLVLIEVSTHFIVQRVAILGHIFKCMYLMGFTLVTKLIGIMNRNECRFINRIEM